MRGGGGVNRPKFANRRPTVAEPRLQRSSERQVNGPGSRETCSKNRLENGGVRTCTARATDLNLDPNFAAPLGPVFLDLKIWALDYWIVAPNENYKFGAVGVMVLVDLSPR